MTAAEQLDTTVARPDSVAATKSAAHEYRAAPKTTAAAATAAPAAAATSQLRFRRRSSLQKIMHICNLSYSVFPHVLIRLQDAQTAVSVDFFNLICALRSLSLNMAVILAILAVFAQLAICCLVAARHATATAAAATAKGPLFLLGCVFVLGLLAFRCFSVNVVRRVQRSLSCKKNT